MELWVALLLCAGVGFAVSYLLGFAVVPWLHKLKFGQEILDIGPSWHKKKQGTPTMGGILIISGFIAAVALVLITDGILGGRLLLSENSRPENVVYIKVFSGILMALAFSFIGFIDDYIKVVKKRNLGLTEMQKTVLQALVILVYLFTLYKCGVNFIFIPYIGIYENALIFWGLGFIAIYCTVNAVNFTDGVDGLCSSVTSVVCIAFSVCAVIMNFSGLSVIAVALFGSLIGFLMWNWNPSKVIMGDLGSLFLGGMVCMLAFSLDAPWLIVLIGCIYVAEFASDILQIIYVKTHNGKRLFKMAPLHHHYEMSEWSEKKICKVFTLVTVIGSVAAVALSWFGRLQ